MVTAVLIGKLTKDKIGIKVQKISNYKTAAAYAGAWLGAAKDMNAEDDVFEEVKALKEGISNILPLWVGMASPIESEQDKLDVLQALAKGIKLSSVSEETLKIVAKNNRLKLVPLILDEFIELYYKDKGMVEVFVESAISLTDEQDSKLRSILMKKLNSDIVISYNVDPEVLGGLSVRFNSYLVDDTIRSKLEEVKKLFAG